MFIIGLWYCIGSGLCDMVLHGRVAQIVGTWARRAEKVEEERENGRKWREREGERESSTSVKYDSVLLRNVQVRYFLSQNVKIWYFFVAKR